MQIDLRLEKFSVQMTGEAYFRLQFCMLCSASSLEGARVPEQLGGTLLELELVRQETHSLSCPQGQSFAHMPPLLGNPSLQHTHMQAPQMIQRTEVFAKKYVGIFLK